jgi:hypothetical protein
MTLIKKPRKRNKLIKIKIDEGDTFEGSISCWENNFGYLDSYNDAEALEAIKEWSQKEKSTFEAINTLNNSIIKVNEVILFSNKSIWNNKIIHKS